MRSNNAQRKFNDDRQREYQRQQERLKAMAATLEKTHPVSADMMIENLLKSSFKKMPEVSTTVEHTDHSGLELPLWLQCNSTAVPAQYKYLWSLVQATSDLADTHKVSQLLLTSGLQVDMLGFIWSLANKAIPGQLTKQEFYIVLALVSLVQTGYTFNSLNILKLITVPCMPVLQLGLLKFPVPQFDTVEKPKPSNFDSIESPGFSNFESKPSETINESNKKISLISSGDTKSVFLDDLQKNVVSLKETSGLNLVPDTSDITTQKLHLMEKDHDLCRNSNFPSIGSSPTPETEDDFSAFQSVPAEKDDECKRVDQSVYDSCDDFSEFQSANIEHLDPFETVIRDQKREIPKIPLPKTFTGKLSGTKSSVLKVSPESGKKLKVLSAAESLSSLPESKISSSNKVSTSVSILRSNHEIGSRLANHSFSSKFEKPKCHKHHKFKINQSSSAYSNAEAEVILGVKTKNLETTMPKCRPKNSSTHKTFLLKETKIKSDDPTNFLSSPQLGSDRELLDMATGEKTRQIEIPMLGTFNETILPTQSKPQITNVDLITVQEDKYSALRQIELNLNEEKYSEEKETSDDFGDFLSADIPVPSVPEGPGIPAETANLNSHLNLFKNESKDGWGDWNCSNETFLNLSSTSEEVTSATNDFGNVDNIQALTANDDLFGSFNALDISDKKETAEKQSNVFLPIQQDYFDAEFKNQNSGDVLMFEETNEKSNKTIFESKTDQSGINQSDKEFWEFSLLETKLSEENTVSTHDSLPNLDLNVQFLDDSKQEVIWRKCIESCQGLIQEGFEIFNNINTKSVLDEVFAAPETELYLNNLNIVCHISKRVFQNCNAFSSSQSELERLWGRIQELCFEYNIKLKPDEDNFSEGKFQCGICLRHVGVDVINHGTSHYHPSCANLWINYIEEILPQAV